MEETLYKYIAAHSSREDEALAWIRKQTNLRTNHARMLSGAVQGQLLTILTQAAGADRALEIGTFTGYASVCIARGLSQGGHLDTLEINDELNDVILEGWRRAGVDDRISLHTGDALESLKGLEGPYDLVYIDANKRQYRAYYETVLPMVRQGGIILADNTLWDGKILLDPLPSDAQTQEIAAFNDHVATDGRVSVAMLPLRDGLSVIRKK